MNILAGIVKVLLLYSCQAIIDFDNGVEFRVSVQGLSNLFVATSAKMLDVLQVRLRFSLN